MTLATFNRYVDNATGVSKTALGSEQHGYLPVGNGVLYWQEDLPRKKFRAKGKHRARRSRGGFFLQSLRIPRKHSLFHKLNRLFGIR